MGLQQKAVKGIFWSFVQKWGRAGVTTITFVILSRLLAPEAFGLVALATAFTVFIELFLDQGFGSAIVQREKLDPEHLDTAFWLNVLTSILMTGGLIAVSGLLGALFEEPRLASVLRWLSITLILSGLSSTQISILQRKLAFKEFAIRSMVANAVGGIVGVIMAFSGYGVWSLVGQDVASGVVRAIILWRSSDWRPRF